MLHFISIEIHGVVIEASVLNKPHPFPPPRGNVGPIVFIQVLPKVPSSVPCIIEVGCEGSGFVGPLPERRGAVIVVGVDVMVVRVHPGQERAPRGAAHGGGNK